MLDPYFSIEELISNSWEKFKHSFIFWIGITLFAFLISALGNLSVVLTFVSMYFSASISLMYINFMRNNQVSINDLVATNLVTFMHFVFVNICCGVAVILGLICFILPGLYLATRLIFAQYLVIDQYKSFDDAIKTSWYITKGHELNIFLFILAMFVLILVGACAFLVGLLVCVPLAGLSSASLYLIFSNHFKKSKDEFQEINRIDSD